MRLALLFALACAPALAAPRASIELLPVAQFAGTPLVLGQVARIHSSELALMRELVHLPLPRTSSGTPEMLARTELAAAVMRHLHLAEEEIAWSGSDATSLAKASPRLDADAIAQAATGAVADLVRSRGLRADVRLRSRPRDMDIAGDARLQVRPLDYLPLRRSAVVWVDVVAGDRLVRSVPVSLEIAWLGDSPAQAGAVESAASPAQSPLRAIDSPTVLRGDWATLRASAGTISLESRVEVLQDGRAGDRVRVRQPGGAGMVFARVIAKGQVELAP